MRAICDWFGSIFDHGLLSFERCVLVAVASRLSGGLKESLLEQVRQIASVQVDPFKTCFVLVMRQKEPFSRIEMSKGLILARVIGTMGGNPTSAELGLCDGVLYAIVTNRQLSWAERKRVHFDVTDVLIFPQKAGPSPEWASLLTIREALENKHITVLRPSERWLHPWCAAWYLCMADIASQYYVLQRCDKNGGLALLDYINDEIVIEGHSPVELLSYAYSRGEWIDDKAPMSLQVLLEKAVGCADDAPIHNADIIPPCAQSDFMGES